MLLFACIFVLLCLAYTMMVHCNEHAACQADDQKKRRSTVASVAQVTNILSIVLFAMAAFFWVFLMIVEVPRLASHIRNNMHHTNITSMTATDTTINNDRFIAKTSSLDLEPALIEARYSQWREWHHRPRIFWNGVIPNFRGEWQPGVLYETHDLVFYGNRRKHLYSSRGKNINMAPVEYYSRWDLESRAMEYLSSSCFNSSARWCSGWDSEKLYKNGDVIWEHGSFFSACRIHINAQPDGLAGSRCWVKIRCRGRDCGDGDRAPPKHTLPTCNVWDAQKVYDEGDCVYIESSTGKKTYLAQLINRGVLPDSDAEAKEVWESYH